MFSRASGGRRHRAGAIKSSLPEMRHLLPAIALLLICMPAANGSSKQIVPIFACGTGTNASEGALLLRGEQFDGEVGAMQFVEETHGQYSEPWPDDGAEAPISFFRSNSQGPEGYYVQVRWDDGDKAHILYLLNKPQNEDGVTEGQAGLVVLNADGTLHREVGCSERPTAYLDIIETMTSCDQTNPLGPGACDFSDPLKRNGPLTLPGGVAID
jgi:hypothetical protein